MEIKLTEKDMRQLADDGILEIKSDNGFCIYWEGNAECRLEYMEVHNPGKGSDKWAFDDVGLNKLKARRPYENRYSDESRCPSCMTALIYHFNHCPKCGQKLDWSEKVGLV